MHFLKDKRSWNRPEELKDLQVPWIGNGWPQLPFMGKENNESSDAVWDALCRADYQKKKPVRFLLKPCSGQQGWKVMLSMPYFHWWLEATRGSEEDKGYHCESSFSNSSQILPLHTWVHCPTVVVSSLLEWCQHLLSKVCALHARITESCKSPRGKGPTRLIESSTTQNPDPVSESTTQRISPFLQQLQQPKSRWVLWCFKLFSEKEPKPFTLIGKLHFFCSLSFAHLFCRHRKSSVFSLVRKAQQFPNTIVTNVTTQAAAKLN